MIINIFSVKDAPAKNPAVWSSDDRQKILAANCPLRGGNGVTGVSLYMKMTMVVMTLVTDMFRIVTLCWPSPLTPLKQPWSGSERGFTGFRYDQCYQDKVPFFNDNSFGKSLGVKKYAIQRYQVTGRL